MPDANTGADAARALTAVIEALKPLESKDRRRIVDAAMTFLGEEVRKPVARNVEETDSGDGDGAGGYPPAAGKWMRQYGISAEAMDQAFHFKDDGSFEVLHAPGKSRRERTLNAYTLFGLGKYLTTGERVFDDDTARALCETIGCYDLNNHGKFLKKNPPEFGGSKKKGYKLTNDGVKRGAELVKELVGAGK